MKLFLVVGGFCRRLVRAVKYAPALIVDLIRVNEFEGKRSDVVVQLRHRHSMQLSQIFFLRHRIALTVSTILAHFRTAEVYP